MNWLFTDMNSYFASVEQHLRPELRGRPVGVIPVESESTCIIAASNDAKRFGVKTGTGVRDARKLCPKIALVKARPDLYVKMHHELLRSVDKWAPVYKVYSIDEWAIQLFGNDRKPERAKALGQNIKRQIYTDFGKCLSCSVGIAPTRLLAKIASDLEKPDGLTLLPVSDLPGRLERMTLKSLCGIGDGMVGRLNKNGVQTIADLWSLTRREAIDIWGSICGAYWWAGFHGIDEPEIPTRRRSMSHANVLDPRFRNDEDVRGILVRLVCQLGARLRHDQYFAQSLRIYIDDVRGGCFSQSVDLPCVQDTATLIHYFHRLWQRRVGSYPSPLRVGADVAGLIAAAHVPRWLFDEIERPQRASEAIDKINQRWGKAAIYIGSMHNYRHRMDDKIAFGRIPSVV